MSGAAGTSLLAPVSFGLHVWDEHLDLRRECLLRAANGLPSTNPVHRYRLQDPNHRRGRMADLRHRRATIMLDDKEGGVLVRLCDEREGVDDAASTRKRWRWEVTARVLDGAAMPDLGFGLTKVVLLTVSQYRITGGCLASAPELALFRHLVAQGFRAIDPDVVIRGGPCDWHEAWWPMPAETA